MTQDDKELAYLCEAAIRDYESGIISESEYRIATALNRLLTSTRENAADDKKLLKLIKRVDNLRTLCGPECNGRCRECPRTWVDEAIAALKQRIEQDDREKALVEFAKMANAFLETVAPYMGTAHTPNQQLAKEINEQGRQALAAYGKEEGK